MKNDDRYTTISKALCIMHPQAHLPRGVNGNREPWLGTLAREEVSGGAHASTSSFERTFDGQGMSRRVPYELHSLLSPSPSNFPLSIYLCVSMFARMCSFLRVTTYICAFLL